jgi:hypothetical protein
MRSVVGLWVLAQGCVFAFGDGDLDGDGLADFREREVGTDPGVADTNGDGLSDAAEIFGAGTDPLVADTDADGLADGEEASLGLDPLDPTSAGYLGGWPRLPEAEKAALETEPQDQILQQDVPFRRRSYLDQHLERVDLFDFAQDVPVLIGIMNFMEDGDVLLLLTDQPTTLSYPPFLKDAILDGHLRYINFSVFGSQDGIASSAKRTSFASTFSTITNVPLFIDNLTETWHYVGRPEASTFILLDEEMVVRGIDDWDAVAAAVGEAP